MENQNEKFTIKSTTKALKLQKRMFTFWMILWLSGFVFSSNLALRNYFDYSIQKTKYATETNEIKKAAAAEEEKINKKKAITDTYGRALCVISYGGFYNDYLFGCRHEPNLFDDTQFYLYFSWCCLFLFFLLVAIYSLRIDVSETKNFLELDGKTGEIRFVEHHTFNRSTEQRRVLDVITGIDFYQGIYGKELNVGELTIHGKYLFVDEVFEEEWTLKFCENITEAIEKVNEFIRKREMDAIKVKVV